MSRLTDMELLALQRDNARRKDDAYATAAEVNDMATELLALRRLVQDAAPLMLTVNAFGADEADVDQLVEMVRWYTQEQQRDYSVFDAWFDAYKARKASP